jgi:adenylate cyclase
LAEIYDKMELKRQSIQGCADDLQILNAGAAERRDWKSPEVKKRRNTIMRRANELLESYNVLSSMASKKRLQLIKAGVANPIDAPGPHPRYLLP